MPALSPLLDEQAAPITLVIATEATIEIITIAFPSLFSMRSSWGRSGFVPASFAVRRPIRPETGNGSIRRDDKKNVIAERSDRPDRA
jgi:hypothetical protein